MIGLFSSFALYNRKVLFGSSVLSMWHQWRSGKAGLDRIRMLDVGDNAQLKSSFVCMVEQNHDQKSIYQDNATTL